MTTRKRNAPSTSASTCSAPKRPIARGRATVQGEPECRSRPDPAVAIQPNPAASLPAGDASAGPCGSVGAEKTTVIGSAASTPFVIRDKHTGFKLLTEPGLALLEQMLAAGRPLDSVCLALNLDRSTLKRLRRRVPA